MLFPYLLDERKTISRLKSPLQAIKLLHETSVLAVRMMNNTRFDNLKKLRHLYFQIASCNLFTRCSLPLRGNKKTCIYNQMQAQYKTTEVYISVNLCFIGGRRAIE
jgi:hypothetical protein